MSTQEEFAARWGGHVPGLMGARHRYAVLCPLVETEEGLSLLFEVRAAELGRQPGETCFPGGRAEAGESPEQCALRETREELSIPPREIRVLGKSDFLCSQSGFILQPVIGAVSPAGLAAMRPSRAEVAATFTVPVDFFRTVAPRVWTYGLEPAVPADFPYETVGVGRDYVWGRGAVDVPVWQVKGRTVWGMTARIVRDILCGTN